MSPSGSTRSTSPARRAARGMSGHVDAGVILHEHRPAEAPQHLRALRAVDAIPGQHDGDRPGTVLGADRGKEPVRRRAAPVERRQVRQDEPAVGADEQVGAGRRHVHHAVLEPHALRRLAHAEGRAIGKNLGEMTSLVRREMLEDQDRRGQRPRAASGGPRRGRPARPTRRRSRSPVSRSVGGVRSRRSPELGSPRHVPAVSSVSSGSASASNGSSDRTLEQGLAKDVGAVLGLARGDLELRHRPLEPAMSGLLRQAPRERGLLLERADGRPEGAFERPRLTGEQRLLAERVADMAAEVEEIVLLPLEEHAAAFGADHGGRLAEPCRVPEARRCRPSPARARQPRAGGKVLRAHRTDSGPARRPSSRATRSRMAASSRAGATWSTATFRSALMIMPG